MIRFLIKLLNASLAILVFVSPTFAEAIFLKDGAIHEGRIIHNDSAIVSIITAVNRTLKFKHDQILRILYKDTFKEKKFFYLSDGSIIDGHIVTENRKFYLVRSKLDSPTETKIEKDQINFIAREKVQLTTNTLDFRAGIGVMQFKAPDIAGITRPGTIVSNAVLERLRNLDLYKITNRVIAENINDTSPEKMKAIAKSYGLSLIITGDIVLKNESILIIRMHRINGKTGKIDKTLERELSISDINFQFDDKIYSQVNDLLDLTPTMINRLELAENAGRQRFGIGLGLSFNWGIGVNLYGARYLDILIYYQSRYFAAEFQTLSSFDKNNSNSTNLFSIQGNPWPFLGFGVTYGVVADGRFESKGNINSHPGNYDVAVDVLHILYVGIVFRPIKQFKIALFPGMTLGGQISSAILVTIGRTSIPFSFSFPENNWRGYIEYMFFDNFSLRLEALYYTTGVINTIPNATVSAKSDYLVITLFATYNFTF